jgi:hypothetical protein
VLGLHDPIPVVREIACRGHGVPLQTEALH